MGACQLIYQSSRDDTNWYDFMYPLISQFQTQATSMVGQQWAKMVLQNATADQTLLRNMVDVPQAISPAIGFSEYDLRPFYPYTAIPATTIGLIYLIILSFFSFAFYLPIWFRFLNPQGHPPLRFVEFIAVRWGGTVLAYLFMSLAYSFVSLAFQINFSGGNPITSETQVTEIAFGNPDAYGHGTFPVYWMLNFVAMCALGLACENVAMVIGQPWTGLWLIFVSRLNLTDPESVFQCANNDNSGLSPTSQPDSTISTSNPRSSDGVTLGRCTMSSKPVDQFCSACTRALDSILACFLPGQASTPLWYVFFVA